MSIRCSFRFLFALFASVPLLAHSAVPRQSSEQTLETWNATVQEASQALKANRLDDAIRLAEAAIAQAKNLGPHDTHLARSLVLRAEICLWEKQNDRAEALFVEAVQRCEEAVGPRDPELVHPISSLANFYTYVAPDYHRVATLYERIFGIVRDAPNPNEHDVLLWSRNLGMIYAQLGQFDRAEPYFARALSLAEKIEPEWATHEMLATAQFYRSWKKYERAESIARRALEAREKKLAATPNEVDAKLDVAVALDELGAIFLADRKLDRAEEACRRSLELVDSFMTADQPDLRPRLAALAEALRAEGKLEQAAPLYQRLIVVTEKTLGAQSPELAPALLGYADTLRRLDKKNEAAALETRASSLPHGATARL